MSEVITTPIFYVLRRGLSQELLDAAEAALILTPCAAAIISNFEDAAVGLRFAPMILRAEDDLLALQLGRAWAEKVQRPMLVIGKSEFLDAVYFDGHIESVKIDAVAN